MNNTTILDGFIGSLIENGGYSERTIRFYREQCGLILRCLETVAPGTEIEALDESTLMQLFRWLQSQYAVSTQKDYLCALRRMCEFSGNYVFQNVKLLYQNDARPTVDWLQTEQATELLAMWKTPLQDIIVTLELLQGLRRVEVLRLRVQDVHIDGAYLTVHGKGRAGGKLRAVPFHPSFLAVYRRWMDERNHLVRSAVKGDSDRLLIYVKGGEIREYEIIKGKAIDKQIDELNRRLGVDFSNHTLRRTFGRELHRSGISLPVIARILGHESTTTTMKYLGLDLDDMTDAMNKLILK